MKSKRSLKENEKFKIYEKMKKKIESEVISNEKKKFL